MISRPSRWLLLLAMAASAAACDLPPDTPFEAETDDTETSSDPSGDSDSLPETGLPGATCAEAILCIVNAPGSAFACFEGLDEVNRAAAVELALCLSTNCLDDGGELMDLVRCTATECSDELVECTNASVTEILP